MINKLTRDDVLQWICFVLELIAGVLVFIMWGDDDKVVAVISTASLFIGWMLSFTKKAHVWNHIVFGFNTILVFTGLYLVFG